MTDHRDRILRPVLFNGIQVDFFLSVYDPHLINLQPTARNIAKPYSVLLKNLLLRKIRLFVFLFFKNLFSRNKIKRKYTRTICIAKFSVISNSQKTRNLLFLGNIHELSHKLTIIE